MVPIIQRRRSQVLITHYLNLLLFGAFGQRKDIADQRFPSALANGPYPITKYVSYGAHTGDPVHRFFQMWQQVNGGKNDLFVWTAQTAGLRPK